MVIRTTIVMASLIIVILKTRKNIDTRNDNNRSETSNHSHNSTRVTVTAELVRTLTNIPDGGSEKTS